MPCHPDRVRANYGPPVKCWHRLYRDECTLSWRCWACGFRITDKDFHNEVPRKTRAKLNSKDY